MPLELAERMLAGIPGSQVEMFRGGHMFFLFTERQQLMTPLRGLAMARAELMLLAWGVLPATRGPRW